MNWRMIVTLVVKDVSLYFRNRFFALITVLGVVAFAGIYFLMPDTVEEQLTMGLYAPTLPAAFIEELQGGGAIVVQAESEDALKAAMLRGDYNVGVALPPDFAAKLTAGQRSQITVYFTSDFPDELKDSYAIVLQELAYVLTGQPLNVEVSEEILGPDMAGAQIPLRAQMLPLLAVIILMMETMGQASLISSEIEGGTLKALLITPLRIEGLFVGKGIMGVGLAYVQVVFLMGVTGGLSREPILILVALLLGSLLVTGIGFLMASVARDMMSVMAWGILAVVVLSIPSFGILLPGTISNWVQAIPSYYLVDAVHRVVNFDAGWSEVGANLLILLAFALAIFAIGVVVLRRKLR